MELTIALLPMLRNIVHMAIPVLYMIGQYLTEHTTIQMKEPHLEKLQILISGSVVFSFHPLTVYTHLESYQMIAVHSISVQTHHVNIKFWLHLVMAGHEADGTIMPVRQLSQFRCMQGRHTMLRWSMLIGEVHGALGLELKFTTWPGHPV